MSSKYFKSRFPQLGIFQLSVTGSENDLREWTNKEKEWPNKLKSVELGEEEMWINQADLFSSFLSKSSKYDNLFIHCQKSKSRRVIIVEEFPYTFIKSPNEFHQILRKYNSSCTCPVIFIVTNTNENSIGRQLFPTDIQDELNITNVTFNATASKFLIQALNRVLNLRSNCNQISSDELPSKQLLQAIAEKSGGDIRSAINTLQFTLTKDSSFEPTKQNKKSRQKTKSSKVIEEIDYIGCKDTKLILFRALGKVLYCKRKSTVEHDYNLPKHLKHHERFPLEENPEEIFERSASDASTFSLWLHHNCTSFFKQIDCLATALYYMTEADIIKSYWNATNSLDDYSASIAIRGMMHSLSDNSNPPTAGQAFRSLTAPAFFNYRQISNERLRKSKELCRTVFCSDTELMTNLIPLAAKVFQSNTNRGDQVLKEIGLIMPVSRSYSDIHNSVFEDLNSSTLQTFSNCQQSSEDAEEDFIIEEYED